MRWMQWAVVCATMLAAANARSADTVEGLLAQLRALPESKDELASAFHDMHGNACDPLRDLMIARFAATARILDASKKPQHAFSLYRVLAFVRDPAALDWLDQRFEGPGKVALYQWWLPAWYGSDRWLEKPDAWAAFFRKRFAREADPAHKVELLSRLRSFSDPGTVDLFVQMEASPAVTGEQRLAVDAYLRQQGRSFDRARLAATIASLKSNEAGTRTLLLYADQVRDEALVPWLISIVKPPTPPRTVIYAGDLPEVHELLQRITFQLEPKSPKAWKAWFDRHGRDGRETWAKDAMQQFQALMDKDPAEGARFLEKAVYFWNDSLLAPAMSKLASYQALHDHLVGWANLTLSAEPNRRPQIEPMIKRIMAVSGKRLAPWATGLLEDMEYLPKKQPTWEEWVRLINSRV